MEKADIAGIILLILGLIILILVGIGLLPFNHGFYLGGILIIIPAALLWHDAW